MCVSTTHTSHPNATHHIGVNKSWWLEYGEGERETNVQQQSRLLVWTNTRSSMTTVYVLTLTTPIRACLAKPRSHQPRITFKLTLFNLWLHCISQATPSTDLCARNWPATNYLQEQARIDGHAKLACWCTYCCLVTKKMCVQENAPACFTALWWSMQALSCTQF